MSGAPPRGPVRPRASHGRLPVALVSLVGLLFVGLACRTAPPAGLLRGAPLPLEDERASRLVDDYLTRTETRRALRGSARVALSGPDFKLNRPQNVVVARPARLRFEVVGLFEQLAAVLVSDGETYGFFDASTGEMETGAVTPDLLWSLGKVDLAVDEAVAILLAAPRPPPFGARAAVWREDEDRVGVAFASSSARAREDCPPTPDRGWQDAACFGEPGDLMDGGEVFVFDGTGRLVEVRAYEPGGALRYLARFTGFRPIADESGSVEFPASVEIQSPAVRAEARFDWKRVQLTAEVDDRWFRLPERRRRW